MTNAVVGFLTAGILALGFALVAEVVLGRRSRNLFGWNESFLIGIGACAALLFPLSLVVPRHALDAELGVIGLCALVAIGRRLRTTPEPGPAWLEGELRGLLRDRIAVLQLATIGCVGLLFVALNHWHGHSWDSVQVWGTKAQMLFFQGGLSRTWFPEDFYDARLLSYPPFISFYEALFSRLRGAFDLDRVKPIFPFFHASMLLSTYAAARTQCSRRWSLATVLLVALLPELTAGAAAGGYVDMPLAAFVAAAVAAGLRPGAAPAGWRAPLSWLLGAMTTVKQEGTVLALVVSAGIGFGWLAERPRRLADRLRSCWPSATVVAAFVLGRAGYVRWIGVSDGTWGQADAEHLSRALANLGLIASLCLRLLLDPRTWGLFWPAFLVAGLSLVTSKPSRLQLLALLVAATALLYGSLFLLTNWPVRVHVEGAYGRLLAQLAPAAAVVIGAWAARIWSPPPGKAA